MAEQEVPREKAECTEEESSATATSDDWWSLTNSLLEKATDSVHQVTHVAMSKSSEVYDLVSKDLTEVSSQASAAVESTASVVKDKLVWGSEWLYCDPNRGQGRGTAVYTCFNSKLVRRRDEYNDNDRKDDHASEAFDERTDEMADAAVESVSQSMSSLWKMASNYAVNMFVDENTDDDSSMAMIMKDNKNAVPLDRLQAQLFALAADPATYLEDVDDSNMSKKEKEDRMASLGEIDLESREGEIADLLQSNKKIRDYYNAFVPDEVSHVLFWRRYFTRVRQLELQESRRQELKRRAELVARAADSDNEINWDEVGDLATPIAPANTDTASPKVMTEDEQERILNDYEKELKDADGGQKGKADENCSSRASPENEKGSNASDDWEKLSSGESTPSSNKMQADNRKH